MSSFLTSIGICGTDCAPSTKTNVPLSWATLIISSKGALVPVTLEAWIIEMSFVFLSIFFLNYSMSNSPSLLHRIKSSSIFPAFCFTNQGRTPEVCSKLVVITLSPIEKLKP